MRGCQRASRAAGRIARALSVIGVIGAIGIVGALSACGGHSFGVSPQGIAFGLAAPKRIPLDAHANGVAVRPSDGAVFVTDDRTNTVLTSPDGVTFTPYAVIPVVSGQANALSQLTFSHSGVLFAERFGFGTASAVYAITDRGAVAALSGPDPARRRLGLVSVGEDELLSTWFVKNGENPPQGGLSLLTYDEETHTAVERDLLTGLGKPVGVAVFSGTVFVTDQANNRIVSANVEALLNAPQPLTSAATFAKIESPDLLAVDASGTLYTKCNKSGLCKIAPDGTVDVLADDFQDARGVAIDTAHHKLYAIDRAASKSSASYLRVFWLKN
jgi:DNA-binding beta-propeller fold protein YncE